MEPGTDRRHNMRVLLTGEVPVNDAPHVVHLGCRWLLILGPLVVIERTRDYSRLQQYCKLNVSLYELRRYR